MRDSWVIKSSKVILGVMKSHQVVFLEHAVLKRDPWIMSSNQKTILGSGIAIQRDP
jgi:hypothetical protein